MILTAEHIRAIMPHARAANVAAFVESFNKYAERFGVTSRLRVTHFLGQVAVESGELNRTEENLNYSADGLLRTFPRYFNRTTAAQYARKPQAIANRVYGLRMGNGPESSGDGWRYRGRGLIMLTGKDNYQRYASSEYCNGDLMGHPEWLSAYPGALKSALWFWTTNGLNALADRDDVQAVTRRINGGTNGLTDRQRFTLRAKLVIKTLIAVLVMCSSCAPQERIVHEYHAVQADTLAVQAMVDMKLNSWHEQMDSSWRQRMDEYSASSFSNEDQKEKVTETITTWTDSLGREMRQEQRTTERSLSRMQQQTEQRLTREFEQRINVVVDSLNDSWQQRLEAIKTHYERTDSTDLTAKSGSAAFGELPWYKRWWQRLKDYLLMGGIIVVLLITRRFWWPWCKKLFHHKK